LAGSVLNKLLMLAIKLFAPKKSIGLITFLLITTFIQKACISLTPSHLLQYKVFHTALFYLKFNLPLTKSSQQRKTVRHWKTPMKSSIVILTLRN